MNLKKLWDKLMSLWEKWLYDKERRKEVRFIVAEKADEKEEVLDQKQRWKYFTREEVAGLVDDLVFKLDRARDLYGHPIVITSGFRTPERNAAVGGVKDSEHLTGKGCDIKAPVDKEMREKLSWALGAAGFFRVGAYSKHFHVGVSKDHPRPAFWFGEYK